MRFVRLRQHSWSFHLIVSEKELHEHRKLWLNHHETCPFRKVLCRCLFDRYTLWQEGLPDRLDWIPIFSTPSVFYRYFALESRWMLYSTKIHICHRLGEKWSEMWLCSCQMLIYLTLWLSSRSHLAKTSVAEVLSSENAAEKSRSHSGQGTSQPGMLEHSPCTWSSDRTPPEFWSGRTYLRSILGCSSWATSGKPSRSSTALSFLLTSNCPILLAIHARELDLWLY